MIRDDAISTIIFPLIHKRKEKKINQLRGMCPADSCARLVLRQWTNSSGSLVVSYLFQIAECSTFSIMRRVMLRFSNMGRGHYGEGDDPENGETSRASSLWKNSSPLSSFGAGSLEFGSASSKAPTEMAGLNKRDTMEYPAPDDPIRHTAHHVARTGNSKRHRQTRRECTSCCHAVLENDVSKQP